ncbi:peptidoglycan-binding domain-containing protein [uncultured Shewanella sp.]|uniref:peptidoglycan-binding domain-containing protein n=1 Tax=uncultured Shewanella sp. TaxID=173975 RepID=UPI00262CA973|nr:peptidoglycan-binding domain-containing protein [uncultured Shewanella sp.]
MSCQCHYCVSRRIQRPITPSSPTARQSIRELKQRENLAYIERENLAQATQSHKPCPSTTSNIEKLELIKKNEQKSEARFDDKNVAPPLKSQLLKNEENLNSLALGAFSSLKMGIKSFEVLKAQEALIAVGFDLGNRGADGHFGQKTIRVVKQFQKRYKPTHNTHEQYEFNTIHGEVDRGTILALDEALCEKWKFKGYDWANSEFGMLLGHVESRNDYSAYNRTKGGLKSFFNTDLDQKTVTEVIELQKAREAFAVGRFQLIPITLQEAVRHLSINKNDTFDALIQDRIFNEYLIKVKRPKIINYLESDGSIEDAIYDWAKEFASAGVEKGRKISKGRIAVGGESYYSGDGLNKAHLSIEKMKDVLRKSKENSQ